MKITEHIRQAKHQQRRNKNIIFNIVCMKRYFIIFFLIIFSSALYGQYESDTLESRFSYYAIIKCLDSVSNNLKKTGHKEIYSLAIFPNQGDALCGVILWKEKNEYKGLLFFYKESYEHYVFEKKKKIRNAKDKAKIAQFINSPAASRNCDVARILRGDGGKDYSISSGSFGIYIKRILNSYSDEVYFTLSTYNYYYYRNPCVKGIVYLLGLIHR